jgi:propanediol dehydratase large subunit
MGSAEQRSMLYLEARCLCVTRGAGSQGVKTARFRVSLCPNPCRAGCGPCLAEKLDGVDVGAGSRLRQRRLGVTFGQSVNRPN